MSSEAGTILKETGAIIDGHFLLTSGLHSATYVEKFKVLQYPHHTQQLCEMITRRFEGEKVDVVAGPTVGGVLLAFEIARQMGVRAIFAERDGDRRIFKRGLKITPGERVLVVDDILTTGGSILEVVDEVERWKGEVIGVGVLVDRSGSGISLNAPVFSCHRVNIPTFSAEECPQCKAGVPLTKRGSKPA
ncbi:MAG: orotate phosphoribosyltransferase [Dehalococcoidia bacterium]|nr:orotate phosphoribosyltransferase [Dehalococcoidia bacterium]